MAIDFSDLDEAYELAEKCANAFQGALTAS